MSKVTKYEYLFTYTFSTNEGKSGTGRIFSTGEGTVETQADVEDMDKQICDRNPTFTTCFITNFQLLRTYEEDESSN